MLHRILFITVVCCRDKNYQKYANR